MRALGSPLSVRFVVPLIAGLILAVCLGVVAGQANLKVVLFLVAASLCFTVFFLMKERAWMIVPMVWFLTGDLNFLPVNISVRDASVAFALVTMVSLFIFKRVRTHLTWNSVDFLLAINLVYLLTVYLRHPVGVKFLSTEYIGGRPYFDVAVALGAYWVIGFAVLTPSRATWIVAGSICSSAFTSILSLISTYLPHLTPYLFYFYSGVDTGEYMKTQRGVVTVQEDPRLNSLSDFGRAGILALASYMTPSRFINPFFILFFLAFATFIVSILMSGFRTAVVYSIFVLFAASYFRSSALRVMPVVLGAAAFIVLLVLGNGVAFNLPVPAQRALSFLPGNWDPNAVANAEASSEWRYQIWERAWNEGHIRNKVFGDGFGFTREDFAKIEAAEQGYKTGEHDDSQLNALITGAYHSGPLSAVRYVGIVGFILYQALLLAMGVYAFKTIKQAKGTPYFPMTLFIGLPILYESFAYSFIFGQFDSHLPNTIFYIAMLKLVNRALAQSPQDPLDASEDRGLTTP